jgi:hypothetical protein
MTIREKHIIKRTKLYKRLFNYLVDNTELKYYKNRLIFRVSNKQKLSNNTYAEEITKRNLFSYQIEQKILIHFDFYVLQQHTKRGFHNDYYGCRSLALDFLRGNKKLLTRFIILHELKHTLDFIKYGSYSSYLYTCNHICEINADKYAYNNLRYLHLIK